MSTTQHLQDFVTQVRRDILRQVHQVNSGHPGGSLGCAEYFSVLYQDVMKYSLDFDMDGKTKIYLFVKWTLSLQFSIVFYLGLDFSL